MAITYLTVDEISELHRWAIGKFGGAVGIRDHGALASCAAMPATNVFGHERFPSLAAKAAAYCYFISQNQPFFDGNKRTGYSAAYRFLDINTSTVPLDQEEVYDVISSVARGDADLDDLVQLFQRAIRT